MSKQKSRLSREKIATAALAIADRDGFEALSMRRVAHELNAGTMSLYYYVKTKDDLIAAMDDALMAEALLPSLPEGWQRAMMAIAKRTHAVFIRHPWALAAMLSAPPGINAMRDMECAAAQLATGAFPRLTEMFGGGRIDAKKDRFERGLRALLAGTRT